MVYGKGRATGYSDYYKNNANTPEDGEDTAIPSRKKPMMGQKSMMGQKPTSDVPDMTEMSPEDKKKMALRRRLQKLRAGK